MTPKQKKKEALLMVGYKPEAVENKTDQELAELIIEYNNKVLKKEPEQRELLSKEFDNGNATVVEVVASYSRKVNLGNYESEDFFCSLKSEVKKEANKDSVYNKLSFDCRENVRRQIELTHKPKKPF